MPRNFMPIALGVFALLVIVLNSAFIVRQDREAIVLRVGQFTRAINSPPANESGLYFKWPFIEEVTFYDRRNLGLELDGQQIVASDQELLVVDAVVRWRITDARLFYQGARTEQGGDDRIQIFAQAALRRALGAATSDEIISGRRAAIMQAVEDDLNRAAAAELGVRIEDVRIRQVNFPQATQERVFARMSSEREQVAARLRAEGERNATIIRATATEQGERIRGEGDGERARIFARAYGRDPEFAAFYRSMRAYDTALDAGTPIVVAPDSDFFRYMQRRRGGN
ncbi:MAG: protease modulator HflC [Hyphomonadaceae bacterium]|jgi:membrane protease subunit HflC|nr:protease modulator HflC [Hyphomonadaceae bacterium]